MRLIWWSISLLVAAFSVARSEDARFIEIPEEFETVIFDKSTVSVVQPGRFTIAATRIDNPDFLRFELKVLVTLKKFCELKDGNYPAPKELLTFGSPDLPIQNIEVTSGKTKVGERPFKMVSWSYPYGKLAWHVNNEIIQRTNFLHCREFSEQLDAITNGFRSTQIFDCKRGLTGLFLGDDADPARAKTLPVSADTRGYLVYLKVCLGVTNEAPYVPQE